jgi:hypothetical protein
MHVMNHTIDHSTDVFADFYNEPPLVGYFSRFQMDLAACSDCHRRYEFPTKGIEVAPGSR